MARLGTIVWRNVGRRVDELPVAPLVSRARVSEWNGLIPLLGRGVINAAIPLENGGAGVSPAITDLQQEIVEPALPDLDAGPGVQSTLSEVEDNRLFNPDSVKPLRRFSSKPVRRLSVARVLAPALSYGVEPAAKDQVVMCIRRKMRRGVILALGQGGGFHRPPRRTPKSDIWC